MRRWIRPMQVGALGLVVLLALGFAVGSLADGDTADGALLQSFDRDDAFTATSGGAVVQQHGMRSADGAAAPEASFDTTAQVPADEGFGDHVIKEASLTVRVDEGDFDEAWDAAQLITAEAGGEIINARRGGNGDIVPLGAEAREVTPFGTLTMRVPAEQLDDVMRRLRGELGEVRSETTSAQDVSQEYVDLQSRLRNLRAEEAALLELYARARNVRDTLAVRERLSQVRGEIEQAEGRKRFIDARTEFSTVSLTLAEPGAAIIGSDDDPSFARAWDTAIEGLVRIGTVGMIAAIWLAPFALLAAIVFGFRRRGFTPPPAPQA